MFQSKTGAIIATGVNCLVVGGRGSYYEFDKEQLNWDIMFVPEDQQYRLTDKYKDLVYYIEYRTAPDFIKVYYQKKYVGYADYEPEKYYIALEDLEYLGEEEIKVKVHKSIKKTQKVERTRQVKLDELF